MLGMQVLQRPKEFRLTLILFATLVAAGLWLGASSASAHTFTAGGECGTATLNWQSFAGSGATPANKPDWSIVKDSAPQPVASGQHSFTGTGDSLNVAIPSLNGEYDASSSWTAANTRDGDTGSGSSKFRLTGCNELSTTASPTVKLGGQIFDTAHLVGGTDDISGSITFKLYADTDTLCQNALTSNSVAVSGNGDYQSAKFTPTAAGGYQWTATYSGDAKNEKIGPEGCGDPAEHVVVERPRQEVENVCKVEHGKLRLTGPTGKSRHSYKFKVKYKGYTRIKIYVDGKKVNPVRHGSNKNRSFTFSIRSSRLGPGVHRIRVVAGAGPAKCRTKQRGLRFVKAERSAVTPEFTG